MRKFCILPILCLLFSCTNSDVVTSIELNVSEQLLVVGESVELVAEMSPEDCNADLIWESSDDNIVTVEDGVVTAISAGCADVIARSGEASDKCSIVVRDNATSILLKPDEVDLNEGDELSIEVKILPENASSAVVEWYSDDESVVTVVDGNIRAINKGQARVIAKVDDVSDTCFVSVSEVIDQTDFIGNWTAYSDKWDLSRSGVCYLVDLENGTFAMDENGNYITMTLMDFCEEYVAEYNSDPQNTEKITIDDVCTRVYQDNDGYKDFADFFVSEDHIIMWWGMIGKARVLKLDGDYKFKGPGAVTIDDKSNKNNPRTVDMKLFYNESGDLCMQYYERYLHMHYNYNKTKQYFIYASTIFYCRPGQTETY